jgi:hypothetical protein
MRHDKDNQWLDPWLDRLIHRRPPEFDFDQWASRFPEEARFLQTGSVQTVSKRRMHLIQIGRMIMTNQYTKLAGAAVVVLMAISFLFPSRHGIVPGSVAWADVQKAIDNVRSARATGMRNCFLSGNETPTYRLRVEKLFSHSGYVDRTFTEDGRLIIEFTYHLPTGTMTVLFPTYKKYYRTQVPPEVGEKISQVTPMKLFEWLFASGDYRKLGPEEVQGIQAVIFEIPDLAERLKGGMQVSGKLVDFFFSIGPSRTRMWVNPETRLPVQVEFEGVVNPCLITGYREMRLHEIDDRCEFGVELDDASFLPAVPEGYEDLALPESEESQMAQ